MSFPEPDPDPEFDRVIEEMHGRCDDAVAFIMSADDMTLPEMLRAAWVDGAKWWHVQFGAHHG